MILNLYSLKIFWMKISRKIFKINNSDKKNPLYSISHHIKTWTFWVIERKFKLQRSRILYLVQIPRDLLWMFPDVSLVTEKLPLDGDLKRVSVQQQLAVRKILQNTKNQCFISLTFLKFYGSIQIFKVLFFKF